MASAAVFTTTVQRTPSKSHLSEVRLSFAAKAAPPCSDPPCKLRSGLYIGSLVTEASLTALQAAGITHVLQAGAELAPSHPAGLFVYKQLCISDEDDEDLVAVFKEAFDFIDEGRKSGELLQIAAAHRGYWQHAASAGKLALPGLAQSYCCLPTA